MAGIIMMPADKTSGDALSASPLVFLVRPARADDRYPRGDRAESERVWEALTFMWISENSFATVEALIL